MRKTSSRWGHGVALGLGLWVGVGELCRPKLLMTNASHLTEKVLDQVATMLRAIVRSGPSKTMQVPLLAGPAYLGKTTMLLRARPPQTRAEEQTGSSESFETEALPVLG